MILQLKFCLKSLCNMMQYIPMHVFDMTSCNVCIASSKAGQRLKGWIAAQIFIYERDPDLFTVTKEPN